MAEPFLSEIRIMSFNFPPKGWAFCNGQLLPINQNQPLFALLGTTYGGNGQTNFALPNLQGRLPVHMGSGHTLGEAGGEYAHTLSLNEMPQHIHFMNASNSTGDKVNPNFGGTGFVLAQDPGNVYGAVQSLTTLNAGTITKVGGSQAHTNTQPYLALNFCIALQGIFPSQT
ncbi:MAG TPA: tail fiber protein [Pyrinomonadaceae bacterium]